MGLEDYLSKSAKEINKEIESFFPRKFSKKWLLSVFGEPDFEFDIDTFDRAIAEPIWDFLDRGGKRWRPALMLLCAEAVGGSRKDALPFVVIPELVHSGSIVTDDVEDSTEMRRGKPAMHKLYGLDLAINNGTLLYYLPMALLFSKHKLSVKLKARLYDIYAQELLKLSFGQGMDIFWHQGKKDSVSEKAYLQMCSYKTGTLARMSAKFGAVLGSASPKLELLFGNFGNTIGVAFQIQDDILNLSEEKTLGKEFAEDIHEGKRTLMVIHSLKNAEKKDAARLLEILSLHTADDDLKREAISIIQSTGSIEYSKEIARGLVHGAWKTLSPSIKESKAKGMLKEFAEFLVERKY